MLYYLASKKATAVVFIWGDRGYPAIHYEYIINGLWKIFGCWDTQNCFAYNQSSTAAVAGSTQYISGTTAISWDFRVGTRGNVATTVKANYSRNCIQEYRQY